MPVTRTLRRLDISATMVLMSITGVLASPSVQAEEGLFDEHRLFGHAMYHDLLDGDVQVAGNHHGGLHLSFDSGDRAVSTVPIDHLPPQPARSGVHFSFRMALD